MINLTDRLCNKQNKTKKNKKKKELSLILTSAFAKKFSKFMRNVNYVSLARL
jgi:hypothetical protein